jgi:hypothetical protein
MNEDNTQAGLDFESAIINFENNPPVHLPTFIDDETFSSLRGNFEQRGLDLFFNLKENYIDQFLPMLIESRRLAEITKIALSNNDADSSFVVHRTIFAVSMREIDSSIFKHLDKDTVIQSDIIEFCEFLSLSYLASAAYSIQNNEFQKGIDFLFQSSEATELAFMLNETDSEKENDSDSNPFPKSYFASLGKNGATVRHEKMRQLRDFALSIYNPQEWKSANQAAFDLKEKILAHSRIVGANLTPSNAQRTIAEWLRKKSV